MNGVSLQQRDERNERPESTAEPSPPPLAPLIDRWPAYPVEVYHTEMHTSQSTLFIVRVVGVAPRRRLRASRGRCPGFPPVPPAQHSGRPLCRPVSTTKIYMIEGCGQGGLDREGPDALPHFLAAWEGGFQEDGRSTMRGFQN